MASRLNAYLSFTDDAPQALEFYTELFGGTLVLSRFGEFGTTWHQWQAIVHGRPGLRAPDLVGLAHASAG